VNEYSDKALEADEVGTANQYEEERNENAVAPATKRGAIKRHCVKWWWLHIIIFCACFLIISLCLVYVAMPKIAQNGVDDSSLQVTKLEFLDPTPSSISLTQEAILHSTSMYTPSLDPFTAGTYLITNGTWSAEPLIYMGMPAIHATHPTSISKIDSQSVQIANQDQLAAFAIAVLTSENVTTGLAGKTKLHEGKLPVLTINYNTTVTYAGLNGLKGFNTTNVKINLTAPAGTVNLKGIAFIPNPSLMTIAMGNVTLTLSTASAGVVGNATIENMTLVPGDNNLPLYAITDQIKIASSMDLKTGIVELSIEGKDAIYNGQHLTYYEKALASNKLTLNMNVQQVIADSLA